MSTEDPATVPSERTENAPTWLEVCRRKPKGPDLPLRKTKCHDCSVECGLYAEISDALKAASKEEQIKLSKPWYCHNTPGLACKGNAENLGIEWPDQSV